MLKALFLDMDETLCDTSGANIQAQAMLAKKLDTDFPNEIDSKQFVDAFLKGIYKDWTPSQHERYQPIRERHGELKYRQILAQDLLESEGMNCSNDYANELHEQFEVDRMAAFDFFPTIKECLIEARKHFTLVVITNGPTFSQIPKLETVDMQNYVDHILIGGQEPEEKPALSIFQKALSLAQCSAQEAIHFGDSLGADILGANKAGIHSVWIKHGQDVNPSSDQTPQTTLESPLDIPAFIENLS